MSYEALSMVGSMLHDVREAIDYERAHASDIVDGWDNRFDDLLKKGQLGRAEYSMLKSIASDVRSLGVDLQLALKQKIRDVDIGEKRPRRRKTLAPGSTGAKIAGLRDKIMSQLNVDATKALDIAIALTGASTHEEVDNALQTASNLLGFYGVEAVHGDYHVDGYYLDIVALYVNSGDTYKSTIIYETETGKFIIWTLGDWVEKNQKKYSIL